MIMRQLLKPAIIIPLSIFLIILAGTIALLIGPSCANGRLNFIDALFTAASATSCTGLTVLDTGSDFTRFGQIVILILIQSGGLGIMTFSTFFVLLFTRHLTIHGRLILQESLTQFPLRDIVPLLRTIFIWVLIIEGAGAGIIFLLQIETGGDIIFSSIFHSVSAFCNAGFSLYRTNLISYQENLSINLAITTLIILGGLGFIVLWDLQRKIFRRDKTQFSLQTKIVLSTSAFLILAGMISVFLLEYRSTLAPLSLKGKILAAYFQSVTARTAGFNTIPISDIRESTAIILMALMFIGGSPGSTCGGIKTTTAAVFFKTIISKLKHQDDTNLFRRAVKHENIDRSLLIIILGASLIFLVTLSLLILQKGDFMNMLFETVSAFATAGLSRGITAGLTPSGKLLIIITMYAGKLGPLTLTAFFIEREKKILYRYPSESIMTG